MAKIASTLKPVMKVSLILILLLHSVVGSTFANAPVAAFSMQSGHKIFTGKIFDKATNKPVTAKITLSHGVTKKVMAIYFSDANTGKYFFAVSSGMYDLAVEADGYMPYAEVINTETLAYAQITKDIYLKMEGGEDAVAMESTEEPTDTDPPAEEEPAPVEEEPAKPEMEETTPLPSASSEAAAAGQPDKEETEDNVVSMKSLSMEEGAKEPVRDPESFSDVQILNTEESRFLKAGLFYEPGQYTLSPENIEELNRVLPYMEVNQSGYIEVGGHSDLTDEDLENPEISKLRASEVVKFLVIQGIDKERLIEVGYTNEFPNELPEAIGKDRRVELKILQEKPQSETASAFTSLSGDMEMDEESGMVVLTDLQVERIQKTYIYFDKKGFFNAKKAYRIPTTQFLKLDSVYWFLDKFKTVQVEVTGHTSEKEGNPRKMTEVSLKRARTIVDYLNERGTELNRMTWKGLGPKEPIASNNSAVGRAKNRRAQFTISGVKIKAAEDVLASKDIDKNAEGGEGGEGGSGEGGSSGNGSGGDGTGSGDGSSAAGGGDGSGGSSGAAALTKEQLDKIYYDVLEQYGLETDPELVFKVQVGAYINPLPPSSKIYQVIDGEIKAERRDDGITRYVTGMFNSLSTADLFRNDLKNKGIADAFVIAFYQNERISISKVATIFDK